MLASDTAIAALIPRLPVLRAVPANEPIRLFHKLGSGLLVHNTQIPSNNLLCASLKMRPVIPYRYSCIHERCPSSVNKSFPRKTTRSPGKKAPILVRQRPSFSSKSTGPFILWRSPHFPSIISRQDHSLALVHG